MKLKAQIMDAAAVGRCMTRISYEIVEREGDLDGLVLVGIHTRGVPMAGCRRCVGRNCRLT